MTIALDEARPMNIPNAVVKVADNVISPLGATTAENYEAVKAGRSALRLHPATKALPEAYFASMIDDEIIDAEWSRMASSGSCPERLKMPLVPNFQSDAIGNAPVILNSIQDSSTRFEKRLILSIAKALKGTGIDPASDKVIFIISSTKGNVDLLEHGFDEREPLGASAGKIARFFGNAIPPIVVSNACISGLCAQITASRCLRSGKFEHAIVAGSDIQSRFIISGFQSFKDHFQLQKAIGR